METSNLKELKDYFDEMYFHYLKVSDSQGNAIVPRNRVPKNAPETWKRILSVLQSKRTPAGTYVVEMTKSPNKPYEKHYYVKGTATQATPQIAEGGFPAVDVRSFQQALADRTEIENLKFQVLNLTRERDDWKNKFETLEKEVEEFDEMEPAAPVAPVAPLGEQVKPAWATVLEQIAPAVLGVWGEHLEIKKKEIELQFLKMGERIKQPAPAPAPKPQEQEPQIDQATIDKVDEYILQLEETQPELFAALVPMMQQSQSAFGFLQAFATTFPAEYNEMITQITPKQ